MSDSGIHYNSVNIFIVIQTVSIPSCFYVFIALIFRISQERNNKGFFAKLKSKFSRKRKERKNDEQGGKHKNTRKRNRHEYAFNNDDNDSGYGNEDAQDELEEDEMDDANNAKRYDRYYNFVPCFLFSAYINFF